MFISALGLHCCAWALAVMSRGYSLGALYWLLIAKSSLVTERRREGMQPRQLWPIVSCPLSCGILVPWPGIESVSPASAVGFLTSGPPEKSFGSILTRLGYTQDLCEIPETFWGLWGALVCDASRVSLATRMSLLEQRIYLLLLFCVIFIILSSLRAKQFSMEWFILIIKRRQYSFGGWLFCLSYKI